MDLKSKFKRIRQRCLGTDLSILSEIYWGQIYNSTIIDSKWLVNKSVSPGRWAVGYNYLYVLYRILDDIRPQNILEFGLGQSTKVIGQYAMSEDLSKENGHVLVEHDPEWEEFFLKRNKGLCLNTNIITLPLIAKNEEGETYKVYGNFDKIVTALNTKFQVISVDGPYRGRKFGRRDVLSCIPEFLDESFVIIFDDYSLNGCVEVTVKEVEYMLKSNNIDFVKAIYSGCEYKNVCVLASKSWRFLATL